MNRVDFLHADSDVIVFAQTTNPTLSPGVGNELNLPKCETSN